MNSGVSGLAVDTPDAMKNSHFPRLVMAPLACGLSLAALAPLSAAPSKKAAAPPAPVVQEAPPAKKPFFQKLNPFRKKDPAPAPTTPAPTPGPAPAKNSKKSAAPPAPPAPPAGSPESTRPPAKNLTTAKTLKPSPSAVPAPAPSLAPAAAVAETSGETPKKAGFFSRLKAKLNSDPDAPPPGEKPARPEDWKERWVVTEDSTAFFEFGPSQASGPDLRLSRGNVVKLAQASRGWARVELEDGRQGYIGTDQMRQAAETDFAEPLLPAGSQFAAATGGPAPKGWSPAAPLPDLPDLPMSPGMENSLLLLPPLEFEGTELKKGSMKLPRDPSGTPTLNPGDALPLPSAAPEPPSLELKPKSDAPSSPVPDPAETPAPAPAAPAPAPAPAESEAKPAAQDENPLPAPIEPTAPPAPEETPSTKPTPPAEPAPAPAPAPAEESAAPAAPSTPAPTPTPAQ
ncbi:MAG: hypothetical protein JWL81_1732 [Verrucomicrobiales bacterium]|nr:hypothetical protein [Verrucomicrobiales bacterium]